MRWRWFILALCPFTMNAELVWLPDAEVQAVFAKATQPVKVAICNPGDERADKPIHVRLYQTGSETMTPVGKAWFWKGLTVLPGQTVLEEIKVPFPKVEAPATFRLSWLDEAGDALAFTNVRVYPDHLLQPLAKMAGERPLGVVDPGNQLKPLLRAEEIEFDELTADGHPAAFKGRLVIVLPGEDSKDLPEHFVRDLCAVAGERGLALVWFQSPDKRGFDEPLVAHPVKLGKGQAILAPASLLAGLDTSPKAQLNLVWLAGLATRKPADEHHFSFIPETSTEPARPERK